MTWKDTFPKLEQPNLEQVAAYIASPFWESLCGYLEETYGVKPVMEYSVCSGAVMEYSVCSGAPGWNLKYKKSGRALCTLYPQEGCFICLVSIGSREAMEAELLLAGCSDYVQELYWSCKPFNGGRWLMINVASQQVLEDAKTLISTRVRTGKGR